MRLAYACVNTALSADIVLCCHGLEQNPLCGPDGDSYRVKSKHTASKQGESPKHVCGLNDDS